MKKILCTMILVPALILSLTMAALAATSDAGVEFGAGSGPEIINPKDPDPDNPVDPSNPGGDKHPLLDGISSRDIHFGEQTVAAVDKIYKSKLNGHNDNLDDKLVGVAVSNTRKTDNWEVKVKISGFKIGTNPTMKNFSLKMIQEGTGLTNSTTSPSAVATREFTLNAAEDGGDGPVILVLKSGGATGAYSTGRHGANWAGELSVLAGTADPGDAKAVMTWSIQANP